MTELEFAQRLKKLRKAKNLTQQELADLLGVSNKSVSRWETGGYPDVAMLGPCPVARGLFPLPSAGRRSHRSHPARHPAKGQPGTAPHFPPPAAESGLLPVKAPPRPHPHSHFLLLAAVHHRPAQGLRHLPQMVLHRPGPAVLRADPPADGTGCWSKNSGGCSFPCCSCAGAVPPCSPPPSPIPWHIPSAPAPSFPTTLC